MLYRVSSYCQIIPPKPFSDPKSSSKFVEFERVEGKREDMKVLRLKIFVDTPFISKLLCRVYFTNCKPDRTSSTSCVEQIITIGVTIITSLLLKYIIITLSSILKTRTGRGDKSPTYQKY